MPIHKMLIISLLSIISIGTGRDQLLFDGRHSHAASGGLCWGYAMSMSSRKLLGAGANCDPMTARVTNGAAGAIDGNYWTFHSGDSTDIIANVKAGDIIVWPGHATYVVGILHTSSSAGIKVSQVESEGSAVEQININLGHVIYGRDAIWGDDEDWDGSVQERYAPIGYWSLNMVDITVENNFSGGEVTINSNTTSTTAHNVPEGQEQRLERVAGQSSGGNLQIFRYWNLPGETDPSAEVFVEPHQDDEYTAVFESTEAITVTNSTGADSVTVDGTTYGAPVTLPIPVSATMTVSAIDHTSSSLDWDFAVWKVGTSTVSTSRSYLFNPVNSLTVTAHFTGTPQKVTGVTVTSSLGQNVSFSWSVHPNANVSYRIYRKPKYGSPTLVTTKAHGTTSFTDPLYEHTTSALGDLYYWDIRAYYAVDATEADEKWYALFGKIGFKRMADGTSGTPTEFSLGNFPNPFNPTTTINFALPVRSDVTLSIYDMMGHEIQYHELPNSAAGRYAIEWDASDTDGTRVPSGVYLYRLVASPTDGSDPFVETRKMLLLK